MMTSALVMVPRFVPWCPLVLVKRQRCSYSVVSGY